MGVVVRVSLRPARVAGAAHRAAPAGLEIVTVALDVDADAARPFIEQAQPEHPSLIDQAHVVDELFGIVNVPNGVWIDEDGMIVRPGRAACTRAATR